MANLEDALLTQKEQTKQEVPSLSGMLGIPLDGQRLVEVPNRNSYVYVRLRSNQSEVIQAYNNQVAIAYNLPVLVERQGNRCVVLGVDSQRYENNWASFAPFLPRHGNTHSFDIESGGGGDIVWVYPRQFTPVLVMPSGSVGAGSVIVNPYTLQKPNGSWLYVGNTGTPSLLPYRPTSATGAVIALIYLNANTGNPGYIINSGTVFSNTITGSSQIAPYIPTLTGTFQIPLAAVRLITGTSAISWDNIYDLRQFLHPMPTGTGGGGGSDSTYLRLDTTNDPLTNTLHIATSTVGGLNIAQTGLSSGTVGNALASLSRSDSAPYVNFSNAVIRIDDTQNNVGTTFGSVLSYVWNSQATLTLNPSDHYFLGTTYSINNANPILEISNFGSTKLTVYGSGRVNIPTGTTYDIGGSPHTHGGAATNSNDLFRCNNCGASAFVGTIATLPGGASLTYNVTSGNENVLVPNSTSQLAKMRLYNTTRGTSALISNCDNGTNTITLTANVPAGWLTGDTITVASQTVSGGGFNWVDLEITSGDYVGKSSVFAYMAFSDSGGAGFTFLLHPFETFSASKLVATVTTQSSQFLICEFLYKLTSNVITCAWTASGAGTALPIIRQAGYLS